MFQNPHIWEVVLAVVIPLLSWGLRALASLSFATAHEKTLVDTVEAIAYRVRDKFLADLAGARDPNSPGGIEVTTEEMSQARQKALELVLSSLKGPALEYAKGRGADFVKGLLSKALDKFVTVKGSSGATS